MDELGGGDFSFDEGEDGYDYDCPQYADFGMGEEDEGCGNEDGFFVERQGAPGIEGVPADWLARIGVAPDGKGQDGEPRVSDGSELPSPPRGKAENEENAMNAMNVLQDSIAKKPAVSKDNVTTEGDDLKTESLSSNPFAPEFVHAPASDDATGDVSSSPTINNTNGFMESADEIVVDEINLGTVLLPSSPEAPVLKKTLSSHDVPRLDIAALGDVSAPASPATPPFPKQAVSQPNFQGEAKGEDVELHNKQVPVVRKGVRKPPSPSYANPTKAFANRTKKGGSSTKQATKSNSHRGVSPRVGGVRKGKSLTEPKTPFLSTSGRSRTNPQPSSTTQELQKIARERALKKQEKEAQRQKLKQVQEGKEHVTKKTLTKPESPKLRVTQRLGASHQSTATGKEKSAEETRKTASGPGPLRLTHPKPFHFATDARVTHTQPAPTEEYVPVAAQVEKFLHKTPKRFHQLGTGQEVVKAPSRPLELTEPDDIHFETDKRLRPSTAKPLEQMETEMMMSMQKFKARPLSSKVMNSAGDLGVPKVEKKAPCVAKGFNFRTDQRAHSRQSSRAQEMPTKEDIRAKMARKRSNSLGSHASRKSAGPKPPTRVVPFKFSTDARAQSRPATPPASSRVDLDQAKVKKFHARKVPDFSKPANFHPVERKPLVQPKPFHLESDKRHEIAQQRLQERLQREAEEAEKSRHFRAQPVVTKPVRQFVPPDKPLTNPVTPTTVHRSQEAKIEFERRLKQEAQLLEHQAEFHARPVPSTTYNKDFSPERPGHVSGTLDVHLCTDERAKERAEFDRHMEEKMKAKEEALEVEKRIKEEQEQEEIKEYRKTLVHKALPIPDYSNTGPMYETHPPTPPRLTQPESPFLATRNRASQQR
uniref:TPX2 C-terminal domain-containing protein n=1 Tax=Mucochytrium quahogii TaxID=96639 RepID=A0A7S2W4Q8_9STRA|mmetsp:Transcript_13106/g.21239  ORF Transcript_13106/g.21239 Transcript_13106/m.21239 type:complete len:876 (+) Transcript_13106:360-2987(+)